MKKIGFVGFIAFLLQIAMFAAPAAAVCDPLANDKGQASHSIKIETAGKYTVWLRMLAPTANQDSVLVKIDNLCPVITADKISAQEFTWVRHTDGNKNQLFTTELTAGAHTVTIAGREAGVGIDKVLFVADPTCIPENMGDNCFSAATATTGVPPSLTTQEGVSTEAIAQPTTKWAIAASIVGVAALGFLLTKYLLFTRELTNTILPHQATTAAKIAHFIQQHRISTVVCASIFGSALVAALVFAATAHPAFELETAKLTGGAKIVTSPKAAGGKYVLFDKNPAGTNGNTSNNTSGGGTSQGSSGGSSGSNSSNGGSSGSSGGGNNNGGSSGSTSSCALPNYPDASCTGVPAGTSLTIINSDVTITTDGTVIDSKDIRGCMIVQAANVIIRKSKITCTSYYGIASYDSHDDGGLVVEDVEIDCDHHTGTGISYEGMTARRVHIHGCENGLDINRNVTLTDSYIHDIYEGATGHGDGIQSPNGSNTTITHNTIYSESTTSSININHDANGPTTSNVTISDNLLAGGAYTVYCPIKPTVNFKLINNRFSRIFHANAGTYGVTTDCQNEAQLTGNVWHDTGQPITF